MKYGPKKYEPVTDHADALAICIIFGAFIGWLLVLGALLHMLWVWLS